MGIFDDYTPRQDGDHAVVDKIYEPRVDLDVSEDGTAIAYIGQHAQLDQPRFGRTICSADDLIQWEHAVTEDQINGALGNIHGILGERMLSLVMESYLAELTDNLDGVVAGMLREEERHKGKGFIAQFDDQHLLRYKGNSNFVILRKDPHAHGDALYKQEKFGLQATEIDGLGYVHNERKYLVIGEASVKSQFLINSMQPGHAQGSMEERVVMPLRSLFPKHNLVYFVLTPRDTAYRKEDPHRLKRGAMLAYRRMAIQRIPTIFCPLPETTPTLLELSEMVVGSLPLTRRIKHAILKNR